MAMVVSPFRFLEMEMEGVSGQALELRQPDLGQTQKPSMPLMWTAAFVNSSLE